MDCDIFDARTSFLSLCQGQFLQFDTLRRAKHSTMMTLYHLHNPDQEMMSTTCTNCSSEIPANQGWRCKECADYELCNNCYQAGHGHRHPHPLMVSVRHLWAVVYAASVCVACATLSFASCPAVCHCTLEVSEVDVLCAASNSGQSFPAGAHSGTEAHAGRHTPPHNGAAGACCSVQQS